MKKSILILVMSSRRTPWGELMDTSMDTWDSVDHPDTRTMYYCGNLRGPVKDNIFYSVHSDSLDDLASRTIEAFELALTIPDWEFMARPNSSCYVHKGNLVKHIQTLPKTNVLKGLVTSGEPGVRFIWGGGQFIFSRDVIERIVARKDIWRNDLMEDVAISRMAEALDISLDQGAMACSINSNNPELHHTSIQNNDFTNEYLCLCYGGSDNFLFRDFSDMRKAKDHFFFRLKQDHNRSLDLTMMRELHKHIL